MTIEAEMKVVLHTTNCQGPFQKSSKTADVLRRNVFVR